MRRKCEMELLHEDTSFPDVLAMPNRYVICLILPRRP